MLTNFWDRTNDPELLSQGFKSMIETNDYKYFWNSYNKKLRRYYRNEYYEEKISLSKPLFNTKEELVSELDRWFTDTKKVRRVLLTT